MLAARVVRPGERQPDPEPFNGLTVGPQRPRCGVNFGGVEFTDKIADLIVEHGAVQLGAHHQRVRGCPAGGDDQIEVGGELGAGVHGEEHHRPWSGRGDEPDEAYAWAVEDTDLPAGCCWWLHDSFKDGSVVRCQPVRVAQRTARPLPKRMVAGSSPAPDTNPAVGCAGGGPYPCCEQHRVVG